MLEQGARGEAVRRLQRELLALGYDLGPAGADGFFGPRTAAATRAFQRAHGLTADGVVGLATQTALNAALAPPSSIPLAVPQGLAAIRATFGDIELVPGPDPQAACYLRIAGDWTARNLVTVLISGIPTVLHICCHRTLAPVVQAAFSEVAAAGLAGEIRSFDGCFCPRYKRRTQKRAPSVHSWAIALDLNAATNRQGTRGDMPPRVVTIFRRHGFKWGGDWKGKYRDPMHFQYCTGY